MNNTQSAGFLPTGTQLGFGGPISSSSNHGGYQPSAPTQDPTTGQYSGPLANQSFLGQPFAVWLGLLLVLFILKYYSEHPGSPLNPADIRISGYNVLGIGVAATVFIVICKVVFNKIYIPGVTELFNAA